MIRVWQIENEPNWWRAHYAGQWRRGLIWLNTKNQERVLSALHNVVRSECPDGTIIVNLKADDKITDWKLYAKYSDVLGLDFYPNYVRSAPVDGKKLHTIASRVKQETGLPTFVSETGYPTGPKLLGFGEENQARYVRSVCHQAFNCDALGGLAWFRFSDSHWKSFPFQENHFGLLTKDGRPKSGWTEYVNQIKQRTNVVSM